MDRRSTLRALLSGLFISGGALIVGSVAYKSPPLLYAGAGLLTLGFSVTAGLLMWPAKKEEDKVDELRTEIEEALESATKIFIDDDYSKLPPA